MTARVVVFATANWLGSPRLPGGLKRAGFEVAVIAPTDNFLLLTCHADRRLEIRTGDSIAGIEALLVRLAEDWQAQSVVPADEGAVGLLYNFWARRLASASPPAESAYLQLLRRSLPPEQYLHTLRSKHETHLMARAAGLASPAQAVAETLPAALAFAGAVGYPVVLKPERGAAGVGIAVCPDEISLAEQHAKLMAGQDITPGTRILIEGYVSGPEVSHLFVAVEGRVLAGLTRLKHRAYPGPFSPSSVVEPIDLPAAAKATRRLAAACGYNGFGSVQFLLDRDGRPQFIEFNTRPIPMMHLGEALVGIDWCQSWFAAMQGKPQPVFRGIYPGRKIALFPQELLRDAHSPFLTTDAIHDVPWDDLELLQSYLALLRVKMT